MSDTPLNLLSRGDLQIPQSLLGVATGKDLDYGIRKPANSYEILNMGKTI